MKKRLILRLAALLLALLTALGTLGACSARQKVLMELEGHTFSANMFELLLSRTKGNLETAGYNVKADSFWDTIIDLESGITHGEYYKNIVLQSAKLYLAAAVIFDNEGLTLSQSVLDGIDQDIQDAMNADADGSKSQMNSILSTFGVNLDILRELYILEAKYSLLQEHLYGTDGSKIAAGVKEDYLSKNGVAFKQILIRAYYYVYETDENGDDIYYLINQNNGKISNVAYDIENGTTKLDEFGKIIIDKNEDPIYFTPDGRIAYDKVNGVRSHKYDGGTPISKPYSTEELKEHKALAEEIIAGVASKDYARFESYIAEYEASGLDEILAEDGLCFLYTTGDNTSAVFNDIADKLVEMDSGDVAMLTSEYGYHVLMKYDVPKGATSDSQYSEWFKDLPKRVSNYLYNQKCLEMAEKIKVYDDIFVAAPSMKEVGINYHY